MKTLHLVSHTHWDREWYRTFQQFRLRLVHLVDSLLDLLDNDRNYKYFMLDGQTIVLDDYLLMRPENEERLRRYIRKGRLVIGPFHILPDEFLVSPEATIRNLLEGGRTCRKFGPRMSIGYIPDPFGHIGQMPQILQGFGIQTACVQRGLSDEQCEFWWEAPDGSRVFMAYMRDGYGNAAGLPASDLENFTGEVRRLRDSLAPHSNSGRHLLLMNGTDHMEANPGTSKAIEATRGKLDGDELVHSTLDHYLAAIQASLHREHIPTVRGELRDCKRSHLLPGVLSTRMWIKQRNHACETLLEKWAEPFSTIAALAAVGERPGTSIDHPAAIIRQAWRLLMECHPHDSICGCSIDQVHDEMKSRFDQVEQIGKEITQQSLDTLAATVQTDRGPMPVKQSSPTGQDPSSTIIVFNPSSFPRTDVVEATVESDSQFELVDEQGSSIPYQSRGLGTQELIHADLSPKELQSMYTAVHDGRVMGMSVLDIKINRQGSVVHLDASVSEHQQPDIDVWQHGVEEITALIDDHEIKSFRVRALSVDASRITFRADLVPGLGWKTYFIQPRQKENVEVVKIPPLARLLLPLAKLPFFQKLASRPKTARPPYRIENDLLIVEAHKDGSLTVTDKVTGMVTRGMNRILDGGDCGDEYNYCPPEKDRIISARLRHVSITRGIVQQTFTLGLELHLPAALAPGRKERSPKAVGTHVTTIATITHGIPRVDIQTTIENNAMDHRLRVHFPALFSVEKAGHDGHFEVVERNVGIPEFNETWVEHPRPEVPQRVFTSVTDGRNRLTVANRGLPEVEVVKTVSGNVEIAVTLLRCVGWLSRDDFSNRKGHAGPFMETPDAQMQGSWMFDYSIIMEGEPVSYYQQAYAFETPLRAAFTGIHSGTLPASGSFLQVTPPEFLVSTIKEAESGNGWIVRGYNLTGKEADVVVQPWRLFKKVELVNLAEEKIKQLRPTKNGTISVSAKDHGIITLLLGN
jgi:mannosylglycerate hydrolase